MFGLYGATNFLCILFLLQTYSQRIQVIYEGQNVAFYCNATGGSKNDYIHYQWEVNNRDLIATDAYFHIRGIQKSDEGEYKCIATQYVNGTPIVATESTFISVRKADSIITQDVEEGILVRILCNVSSDEKPDGAGPFRYEWRNPNGTLVGTQWKLELGHIKVHESGIYVCRVSYEFDKRQMSTSSATKINVIPRAGVIFPGIRGNVLEVLETGDILQECQVVSAKPSQYNFQWFGPDGRLISNSAFLQRDYITRQRDEGIYRCVGSPIEEGRLQVENSLIVTTAPLRFQITTLEEDLNIGGFTHRRIILVDSSKPNLTTRETFIYQWLDTEMNPILDSMGPDLRINFHSPSDFGRYSVRITGLNSGYQRDLSTYITLDGRNGEVEPTYSVVIREISGPLYLNARLELECSPRPPNSAARINWLGPDGMVVSDSSNIVFERFQPHHQGRYTCQILLPNQIILRQSVELVVSGTSTEIPEPDRLYTIRIIQSPTYFRYNDAVHLQCIVSPTPPLVSYEWFKDGVLIGRQADIHIERFSPDDVGRYQCVARLDSMVLTFNSTISIDDGTGVDLIMRPNIIYIPAFHPFEIECLSIRTGLSPIAIFGNGAPIESDNRFTIIKPNEQRLIIKATDGLSSVYNGLRIRCMLPGLNYKEVTLYIMDICTASQSQCRTRQCIQTSLICDGKADCLDKSDEGSSFCNAGLTVIPTRIVVKPSEPFSLKCQTILPGTRMPHARFVYSGKDVESDPRFIIERSPGILLIKAPNGLSAEANDTRIECYFPDESPRTAIINVVPDRCGLGYFMCYDGSCIQQSQRCDGQTQCPDGSDEIKCVCQPPRILCSSGECITTEMRCDGIQHCRDGSDEIACPPRCRPGQYQCSSGECIEQQMRCDGRQDCRDASDETGCPPRCRPGQYQCSSGECIEQQMRCDGRQDCRDASDETGCPPRCRPGQYQCSSGECIEQQMRCDGRQDCRDASDETGCPPRCRPGQYQCSSGECIEQQMRCDGRQDCRDASDETGCPPRCRPGQYQCSSGECIEQQMRCDGRQDCRDASDETGCPPRCRPGQYQCSSGECIEQQMRCDGRQDCRDASDETGCRERVNIRVVPDVIYTQPYERWKFECSVLGADVEPIVKFQDGRLVESDPNFRVTRIDPNTVSVEAIHGLTEKKERFSFICTFPGGPEEEIDVFVRRRCPHGQFMCKDGTCRPETDFCNGQVDCPDGSDERPPYCRQIIQVEIKPSIIHVQPYKPFEFECISHVPGIKPEARLSSGILVSQDPRFNVEYLSPNRLRVNAIYGLTDRDHPFQIHCIFPGLENRTTVIEIERPCPSGQFQCMDGRCLPFNLFCDGKSDCSDSSDESERYCAVNIRVTPGSIRVIPNQRFQFECSTSIPGVSPQVTFDERSVERDNRFVVTRPSLQTIVVTAPTGISDIGAHKFKCIVSVNIVKEVDVEIISECPPGQAKCRSGECLPRAVFCDGKYDCSDRSDEDPRSCVPTIIITPSTILTKTHESFQFECKSVIPGGEPQITLEGSPVENDPRFTIIRPSREHVIVRAENGIADPGKYSFTCTVVSAPSKTIVVQVESVCPPGYSKCKDGTCILSHQFCDGIAHCRDGSDEDKLRCPEVTADVRVHFTPGELRIQPGRAFRLECVTDRPGTSPVLQFLDGRSITSDQRFVVSRPSTERAVIDVPGGLDARDRQIIIECISPSGERKTSTIFIELGCQPGQRRCPNGQCIFVGQFCDGKPDCDDGFDERPENCEYCDPITKPCEIVNGISPREKTYELHWRCDGEDDCGNRFDEQNCLNDTRVPNKECGATHFRCGTAPYQYIPFAYWCDGGRDCRGGEDEADCSPPTIIQTQRQETHRVRPGGRLILECEASGVPPPMIIWRFNWRCLRDETRMRTQAVPSSLECKGSKSRLTIENFREGDDGIYNCEALTSKERAMSQDIFVFLSP
ncbi:unnamed protein product [Schistosoma rodhaini]|uniref:Ig-like domain-containing protein n=1 Tax=Schistosoma rodhaini TaxID=6188 RepID=A0AA85EMD6_9TREM|nr:unnamed protein product [Schistosoma rodhaini]CAH8680393.1 unnamed protein product [Schistosoma rodhaini]CAH8680396.1 unnamed protein product [Schistosoma rodhaini]